VLACGGLTNSSREGPAPGMSGDSDAVPVIDDRTRQLIADLVETGVQTALAAARNVPAGNEGGAARQEPLPDSGASRAYDLAEIHTGASGAPEVSGGGSGGRRRAPGPPHEADESAEEEEEEGENGDDVVEDTDGSHSAGGPQAFTPGWYEAHRGRFIPPRFDPNYFVAFPAVTSRPAMAMCAIGYAGPPTPSKLRMYRALATRAGVPRSRP
jgi:hypothetical protein